jgi:hypothetical protein
MNSERRYPFLVPGASPIGRLANGTSSYVYDEKRMINVEVKIGTSAHKSPAAHEVATTRKTSVGRETTDDT